MSDSTPTHIGKYRVVASLGQGGMARVFLALTQGPGKFSKLLVIKEIRVELAADDEFQKMFLTEARIAARLNHPNVVHTYEVGEDDGRCFLAMEYLEGQPLSALISRLRKKDLSLELQVWILSQTLAGLHYAHELSDFDGSRMEIIHRDVSPPNIFVTYDGAVKLLDFGIAKVAGSDGNTRAGTFKGKLAYAAPEQIQALPVDRRADVFAVGVMLWEVLAKRRLTQGEDDAVIFGNRLMGRHPDILEVAPDTPAEIAAICRRAMAHAADDRYATAAEMQSALETYLEHTTPRSWSKELASTLSAAFAAERASIRTQIETQVKQVAETPASKAAAVPLLVLEAEPGSSSSSNSAAAPRSPTSDLPPTRNETPPAGADTRPPVSLTTPSATLGLGATAVLAETTTAPTSRRGASGKLLGVAALVIVGLVVALGLALRGQPGAATAASTAVASASNAVPSPPLGAGSASKPAGEDARVTIVLRVRPDSAVITLDGTPVTGNPFRTQVPKDTSTHRVTATANGYQKEERMLTFERDASLEIELSPAGKGARNEPAVAAPPGSPTAKKTNDPSGMGVPLTGPDGKAPKGKRTIDDKDPYAQ